MEGNEVMMRADTVMRMPALPRSSIWQLLASIMMMLVVASNPAVAAGVQVYDVEIIVFSNHASGDDGEHWPTTIPDDFYTQDFVAEGQYTELPESTFQLNGIAYGLKQSRGYKVLLHTAWRLPARDARNAISVPVESAVPAGGKVLSGNIKLIREHDQFVWVWRYQRDPDSSPHGLVASPDFYPDPMPTRGTPAYNTIRFCLPG